MIKSNILIYRQTLQITVDVERTAASAMETAKIANAPDAPDAAQIADAAIRRKRTQNDMVLILYIRHYLFIL